MPINKVDFFGKTLIDISDSTVSRNVLPSGVVAYSASGERLIGIKPPEKVEVTLLASKWVGDSAPYTQEISIPGMTSIWMTDGLVGVVDSEESVEEVSNALSMIGSVESFDGKLLFSCPDEKPGIDLNCTLNKAYSIQVSSENWIESEDSCYITISVPGITGSETFSNQITGYNLDGKDVDDFLKNITFIKTEVDSITIYCSIIPDIDFILILKE